LDKSVLEEHIWENIDIGKTGFGRKTVLLKPIWGKKYGKTIFGKLVFGHTDFGKTVLEKTILETKIGFGKIELGKIGSEKNRFWERTVLE